MHTPLGSLQVIVGLFQLSDVFVKLLLDAAHLTQVVLQQRDLLVALRILLLQLFLRKTASTSGNFPFNDKYLNIENRKSTPSKQKFSFMTRSQSFFSLTVIFLFPCLQHASRVTYISMRCVTITPLKATSLSVNLTYICCCC